MKALKIWAHLDNFNFHFFMGGTKGKNQKSLLRLSIVFLNFSLWFHLWNIEIKSCLNELKFWEASENYKSSICWKFQLSISWETQKSFKMPQTRAKMIWFVNLIYSDAQIPILSHQSDFYIIEFILKNSGKILLQVGKIFRPGLFPPYF